MIRPTIHFFFWHFQWTTNALNLPDCGFFHHSPQKTKTYWWFLVTSDYFVFWKYREIIQGKGVDAGHASTIHPHLLRLVKSPFDSRAPFFKLFFHHRSSRKYSIAPMLTILRFLPAISLQHFYSILNFIDLTGKKMWDLRILMTAVRYVELKKW